LYAFQPDPADQEYNKECPDITCDLIPVISRFQVFYISVYDPERDETEKPDDDDRDKGAQDLADDRIVDQFKNFIIIDLNFI
jgi:hypothetical protein